MRKTTNAVDFQRWLFFMLRLCRFYTNNEYWVFRTSSKILFQNWISEIKSTVRQYIYSNVLLFLYPLIYYLVQFTVLFEIMDEHTSALCPFERLYTSSRMIFVILFYNRLKNYLTYSFFTLFKRLCCRHIFSTFELML